MDTLIKERDSKLRIAAASASEKGTAPRPPTALPTIPGPILYLATFKVGDRRCAWDTGGTPLGLHRRGISRCSLPAPPHTRQRPIAPRAVLARAHGKPAPCTLPTACAHTYRLGFRIRHFCMCMPYLCPGMPASGPPPPRAGRVGFLCAGRERVGVGLGPFPPTLFPHIPSLLVPGTDCDQHPDFDQSQAPAATTLSVHCGVWPRPVVSRGNNPWGFVCAQGSSGTPNARGVQTAERTLQARFTRWPPLLDWSVSEVPEGFLRVSTSQ